MTTIIRQTIYFAIIASLLAACGGPSTFQSGGDEIPTPAPSESTIDEGMDHLEDQDLVAAEQTFCEAYDAGEINSEVAFGCFLTQALLLPESANFTTLLESFDEPAMDTEEDIIEDIIESYTGTPSASTDIFGFNYQNYSHLPLSSILNSSADIQSKWAQVVNRLVTTGTSAEDFRNQVQDLIDDFEYLETLLDSVLADPTFSFTIPEEVFNRGTESQVEYHHVNFMMSGVKSTIVTLSLFSAYDLGMNPEDVVNEDGDDFDLEVLVEDFNGTGATVNDVTVDSVAFLTLVDSSLISSNRIRFIEAIEHLEEGLSDLTNSQMDGLLDSSITSIKLNFVVANETELNDLLDDLKISAQSSGFQTISAFTGRVVKMDLYEFFTNPPSATDVSSSDPFIYDEDDDKISMVEAFLSDLFIDIIDY